MGGKQDIQRQNKGGDVGETYPLYSKKKKHLSKSQMLDY